MLRLLLSVSDFYVILVGSRCAIIRWLHDGYFPSAVERRHGGLIDAPERVALVAEHQRVHKVGAVERLAAVQIIEQTKKVAVRMSAHVEVARYLRSHRQTHTYSGRACAEPRSAGAHQPADS